MKHPSKILKIHNNAFIKVLTLELVHDKSKAEQKKNHKHRESTSKVDKKRIESTKDDVIFLKPSNSTILEFLPKALNFIHNSQIYTISKVSSIMVYKVYI